MFLSGTFSGAATKWAIVEKEAYAIVETCRRAEYLLHCPGGFNLYTDHQNLRYIFNPHSIIASVPKYTAAKLQRWDVLIMAYHYKIHDISGVENIWVDLLSRWGSPVQTVCAIYEEPRPLSPSLDSNYVWPTMSTIVKAQQAANIKFGQQLDGVYRTESGRIWIPDEASELQVRLCVVAHFGTSGHRRVDVTTQNAAELYTWTTLKQDVHLFVKQCLHCSATDGTLLHVLGKHYMVRNRMIYYTGTMYLWGI